MSEETEAADMKSCACCGTAEVDEIKLKDCDDAILFDIAVMNVRRSIDRNMKGVQEAGG